jgi:hypothetical protein
MGGRGRCSPWLVPDLEPQRDRFVFELFDVEAPHQNVPRSAAVRRGFANLAATTNPATTSPAAIRIFTARL